MVYPISDEEYIGILTNTVEGYKAALDKLWDIQRNDGMDEVDRDRATYDVLKVIYD